MLYGVLRLDTPCCCSADPGPASKQGSLCPATKATTFISGSMLHAPQWMPQKLRSPAVTRDTRMARPFRVCPSKPSAMRASFRVPNSTYAMPLPLLLLASRTTRTAVTPPAPRPPPNSLIRSSSCMSCRHAFPVSFKPIHAGGALAISAMGDTLLAPAYTPWFLCSTSHMACPCPHVLA